MSSQLSVQSCAQPSQWVLHASGGAGRTNTPHSAAHIAARSPMAYSASTRRVRSQREWPPNFRIRLVAYIFTVRGEIDMTQPISR